MFMAVRIGLFVAVASQASAFVCHAPIDRGHRMLHTSMRLKGGVGLSGTSLDCSYEKCCNRRRDCKVARGPSFMVYDLFDSRSRS